MAGMIALDTNLFIYWLEGHRDFGQDALYLLELVEQTSLEATASALVLTEVLASSDINEAKAELLLRQLQNSDVAFRSVTEQVLVEAARLKRNYGLRTPDAIHLSSALLAGATHFVTNDHTLLSKKIPGIKITALTATRTTFK